MRRTNEVEAPSAVPTGFVIALRNRQRTRRVHLRLLREITCWLLQEQLHAAAAELCLHLVSAREMAGLNQRFLQHEGSTDVITFDHSDLEPVGTDSTQSPSSHEPALVCCPVFRRFGRRQPAAAGPDQAGENIPLAKDSLHGEIFISLDDAVAQAKQFRATWQSELARYVIHGLLHLAGYDDFQPSARRRMKRAENRLLWATAARFPLSRLARPAPPPAPPAA